MQEIVLAPGELLRLTVPGYGCLKDHPPAIYEIHAIVDAGPPDDPIGSGGIIFTCVQGAGPDPDEVVCQAGDDFLNEPWDFDPKDSDGVLRSGYDGQSEADPTGKPTGLTAKQFVLAYAHP